MTYASIEELPDHVRSSIPSEAQECFLRAYNSVCARARHDADGHEVTQEAEQSGWDAVKRVFEMTGDGKWQKRTTIEQPWSDGQYQADRR